MTLGPDTVRDKIHDPCDVTCFVRIRGRGIECKIPTHFTPCNTKIFNRLYPDNEIVISLNHFHLIEIPQDEMFLNQEWKSYTILDSVRSPVMS